jgi:cell division protein FtsA
MSGVLDLAQEVLKSNVRIATPDYIGVREPQYTIGVGLIKHAYQKAKLRGKGIQEKQEVHERRTPVPVSQPTAKPKPREEERMISKMKKVIRYLWD